MADTDPTEQPAKVGASFACSAELPLYTRNPSDFAAVDGLVDIVTT